MPHTRAMYLETPTKLQDLLDRDRLWTNYEFLPAKESALGQQRDRNLKDALSALRLEYGLGGGSTERLAASPVASFEKWTDDPSEFEDYDEFEETANEDQEPSTSFTPGLPPSVWPLPTSSRTSRSLTPLLNTTSSSSSPYVVLLRHGRTPHNQLGLFTGWEDPPLAPEGVEVRRAPAC